ncbi:TPM domain-containing protein [Oribacterium parvum]|jgi:hypothetical protein|uniref:TPM domain-containing protein n=1 Tax=Oribacterium parvum TaxID=1501329 RepID=UPI0028E9D5D5|nr:TPM domain-containing protein [Oribacterium parvum]
MKNSIFKALLLAFCISTFMIGKSYALDQSAFLSSSVYQNSDTGYTAYIDDEEDLLSSSEEENLLKKLVPLTQYGNVAFLSGRGEYSAAATIRDFYNEVFYGKSGLIFFIDMENREIRIQSGGAFYRTISSDVANSITDNVYVFASNGDYYRTAAVAFSQVKAKMEGRFVATPMRWISNFFLAIFLGLLFNFTMLLMTWKQNRAGSKAVLGALRPNMILGNREVIMTNQTKVRLSSSSSRRGGRSGGGFSGGGRSGGGFSSGGGGHRF